MKRRGWFIVVLVLAFIAIGWKIVHRRSSAFDPLPPLELPGDRIVRIYDVGDLIDDAVDEPEEPWVVSARNVGPPIPRQRGGGSGGGIFTPRQVRRLDELTKIINALDLGSWRAERASVTVFAKRLVVVQTRQNHELIAALLREFRAEPVRRVRLEAIWALIKPEDMAHISAAVAGGSNGTVFGNDEFSKLPSAILWRGEATCRNGNTAQISCGQARTILAKVEAEFSQNDGGFAAKTQQLLDGAMLEVTASLNGDGSSVLLDLRSEVTRFGAASPSSIEIPPAQSSSAQSSRPVKLDRLNLGIQSISTSVSGPTGTMILIGSTTNPDANPDDPRRLYLFIKAAKTNPN